ncbi:MAG: hypothetical protein R3E01_10735 [Pirellulaceae bacterium]|nr:hypothetical protein [Planctomycetales bacterium]
MNKLSPFLFGLVVGAALMFVGLKYHIVLAADGLHVVPKTKARLVEAYVDIRQFGAADWQQHASLALALTEAGKASLVANSVNNDIRRATESLLPSIEIK